tara:strand:+ start:317 stop:502 length:186 start_codon:yes stop_codon:yes gene_type:complete
MDIDLVLHDLELSINGFDVDRFATYQAQLETDAQYVDTLNFYLKRAYPIEIAIYMAGNNPS